MNFRIQKLPDTDTEQDMFYLEVEDGKYERSELRQLIGKLDNEI